MNLVVALATDREPHEPQSCMAWKCCTVLAGGDDRHGAGRLGP